MECFGVCFDLCDPIALRIDSDEDRSDVRPFGQQVNGRSDLRQTFEDLEMQEKIDQELQDLKNQLKGSSGHESIALAEKEPTGRWELGG